MALDVIITPASGLVDFQNSGISSATIQLDGSGNLNIASSGGDIQIGDTSSDVYIGDGVNNVDIVFEQSGEIRGLTGKTITLGQSDSFVAFAGNVTGDVTFTGKLVFPDNGTVPDNPTNEQYDYMTFGANGSISQVSGRGALMIASSDDALILANGDVGRTFTSSNINADTENIFLLSDANVTVKTDLQSGFGSENTYTFAGGVISSPRFTSTQATGTAPFTVSSTTVVSNLNADTVDGIEASSFLRSDQSDTMSGNLTMGNNYIYGDTTSTLLRVGSQAEFRSVRNITIIADDDDTSTTEALTLGAGQNQLKVTSNGATTDNDKLTYNGNIVWHAGNDGTGTGLDADTVDGIQASSFLRSDADDTATGLLTLSGGINVSGVSTFQSHIHLGDDDELRFGDGSELKIEHRTNGDSTITETGSGALYLGSSRVIIADGYTSDLMADFNDGGSVDLYHNHIKKFETTGYGVTVSGGVYVSGISTFQSTVSIGTTIDIVPYNDLGALSFEGSAGQLFSITNNLTSGSIFSVNDVSGIPSIDVDADGTVLIAPYGSTEYVGIGTTNPTAKLDVNGTLNVSGIATFQGNVNLGDDDRLRLGDSQDLQIYSDGSNAFIKETIGSGSLYIDATNLVFREATGSEKYAQFNSNSSVDLYYDNSKKFETTGYGVTVSGGVYVSGISTFQGGIHDGTSLGTSGQVLSSTGTGLSWIDAAAGGGGGGSGTFDTGITTSIYVSVTSGVGANTAETNDIFVGPSIAYTFPSTSGKKYVIESIHITNTFANELYFVGRHDFNGGSNVPLAQRVIVPYQGATEFLDQPIIANPSDILRFQALTGTGSTATGIDGGLDAFITYSTKDDTDYIGTGKTVTTAAGTEIFQATSNPAMLQSIKLCNYSLNSDIDASISIYNGGLSSGVRQGYLAYNLTIPKNSVIEILEKPKYLATNAAIVGGASAANVLGVTLSGKYIT